MDESHNKVVYTLVDLVAEFPELAELPLYVYDSKYGYVPFDNEHCHMYVDDLMDLLDTDQESPICVIRPQYPWETE